MNPVKKINMSEEQKLIKEYANDQNAKMQKILSNTDYIKWLDRFTIEHSSFFDKDWLHSPEKISKEDLERVNNLHLMYRGIDTYANKNYIYPTSCNFGNFYNIKLENIGFEIGILGRQGTLFFCNRVSIENQKDFIDFNDILNNKNVNVNATAIENKLNELSNLITSLYKSGIPLKAIKSILNNTLKEISSQTDIEQPKILKRK